MSTRDNVWLDKFYREAGIKSSIIIYGNTTDIILSDTGIYEPLTNVLISKLKKKGYDSFIKWDRVDGIDQNISDMITPNIPTTQTINEESYDIGGLDDEPITNCYSSPDDFFPYILDVIRYSNKKTAIIIDYSDFLFGNANSLSENERNYLAVLSKALDKSQKYDCLSDSYADIGNIVILITRKTANIPPLFYIDNPLASTINVPMPSRNDRKKFIETNLSCFKTSQDLNNNSIKDDLIDSLDGFSLKEIMQIMKLSRQIDGETLSIEKLISLYKYGEKISPWEELSKEKLSTLVTELQKRVKGQDEAISKVKEVIIRAYTGFSGLQHSAKQRKPKGTLFFVGPTGVGKTELAKALAEFVFGDENACIRFDMSEYNHEHSDQRLVGAPPGYVGYEAGGQLTNAVKERPFCVLLFDEIEKAHGKILDKFLQILEDGRLTDGKGETVNFSETIIIFTSNIGAAKVDPALEKKEVKKQFIAEVQKHFISKLGRPELLNRIGNNIVAFNFIGDTDVFTQIAKIKFNSIKEFVKEKYNAELIFKNEEQAFKAISNKAGTANGGRGLLNVMETAIVNPLAEYIFERTDLVLNRTIVIKPLIESNPEIAEFDFELK